MCNDNRYFHIQKTVQIVNLFLDIFNKMPTANIIDLLIDEGVSVTEYDNGAFSLVFLLPEEVIIVSDETDDSKSYLLEVSGEDYFPEIEMLHTDEIFTIYKSKRYQPLTEAQVMWYFEGGYQSPISKLFDYVKDRLLDVGAQDYGWDLHETNVMYDPNRDTIVFIDPFYT